MADRYKGAIVRLVATIARSRYEADGGTLIEGIHLETILDMALAAKCEVDSLRADLARVTKERDDSRADIAQFRAVVARMSAELNDAIEDRDAARANLARVTAELDEAIEDRRQARDGTAHAAALLAVRTMERDDARADYTRELAAHGATIRERGLAIERAERAERERDARPAISREDAAELAAHFAARSSPFNQQGAFTRAYAALRAHAAGSGANLSLPRILPGDFDHVGIDLWTRGTDDGSALERVQAAIDALRANAAGSGNGGSDA